jgi:hypothetical protein
LREQGWNFSAIHDSIIVDRSPAASPRGRSGAAAF